MSRRLLATAAAVAYLAAAVGLPVPVRSSAPSASAPGCCSAGACGCSEEAQKRRSCCCSGQVAEAAPEPERCEAEAGCCQAPPQEPEALVEVRWVIGEARLRCGGQATQWLSVGAVLPPEAPQSAGRDAAPVGALAATSASPLLRPNRPDIPPPRGGDSGTTLFPVSTGERSAS